jgi:EEF1A N-terminal glycine/lysine methyltransferase
MGDISDAEEFPDLFSEPEGYYKDPPPATFEEFTRRHAKSGHATCEASTNLSPRTLKLRLIGQHPLWAHYLWNASKVLSDYFDLNAEVVLGKKVLELGAGAALPSLVAACNGAEMVRNTGTFSDNRL